MTTTALIAAAAATDTTRATIRALIVDDHELVRYGLRLLLETSLDAYVFEADGSDAAMATLAREPIDIALLDVKMPGQNGISTLASIRARHPNVPVVMLTAFAEPDDVRAALEGGAAGFVLKEATPQQLRDAVATAMSGRGVYVHPVAAQALVTSPTLEFGEHLTEREREVLQLLVNGDTNEGIAEKLFLTEKTVKTHLSSIFRKLGVTNRTQAATRALRDRLLGP